MINRFDKFERHLSKHAPEHIGGYRNGWLRIECINCHNHNFYHIYENESDLITTLVEF